MGPPPPTCWAPCSSPTERGNRKLPPWAAGISGGGWTGPSSAPAQALCRGGFWPLSDLISARPLSEARRVVTEPWL